MGKDNWGGLHPKIRSKVMETEWVALDLRMPNPKSADPRDGIFVMLCSYTTFDNKR